jgi:tetratricopeptide (TPR) repeat protein
MADLLEVVGGYLGRLTGALNWENLKLLVGAVVLLWAGLAVNRKLGILSWLRGMSKMVPDPVAGLRSRQEAVAAEKAGDFLNAGLHYEKLSLWDKALECYEKAEEYHLAGQLCLRLGHKEVAAEWFLLSNEKLRAAQLYRELGKREKAAEAFVKAGDTLEAAAEYLEAGKHGKAAEIYERAGNLVRASEAHERGGDFRKAGDCLKRHVTELESRGSHYRAAAQDLEIARLCHRVGRLFEKAGETEEALELYERGGQIRLAAQLAEKLGMHRKAAELYRKAGAVEKAAELYEKAGDAREAANLVGDAKLSAGDAAAAAEAFVKAGDFLRAAEVFENAGLLDRASECYEKSGAYREAAEASLRAPSRASTGRAADLFVKAGEAGRAAELYFELGDFHMASMLFGKAGRHFEAAKAAAEANSETQMVEHLQRVPPEDPNYLTAVREIARSFERRGWASLAQEKLRTVLEGKPVAADNLELWDQLARAEEAQGNLAESAAILHKMMVVQYGYQGASERYGDLQRRIVEEKKRSDTFQSKAPPVVHHEGKRRYEILGMLGKGGMGAVYRAYDHLLGRHVAYKVLGEAFAANPQARDSLLHEARAAAQLNHPNVVTIFDLGVDRDHHGADGETFISMELVEGESYQSLLRGRTWLAIDEALHWLVSVCQGLDHAHGRGIVHRDLKPSNVLLAVDHRVKILDFGLARRADNGADEKSSGALGHSMSGTPKYIPPEAIQGGLIDARSDVYSLGATLYELLTGTAPFTEGNLLMHHLHTAPPPLRARRSEIPQKLEELVLLCLAKAPGDRFQSAGEVLSFAAAARIV